MTAAIEEDGRRNEEMMAQIQNSQTRVEAMVLALCRAWDVE